MDWIDTLQWPAMVLTVWAAWFVASNTDRRRRLGFWLYLLSNAVWTTWGLYTQAYALVLLQFALATMNIVGARKAAKRVHEKDGVGPDSPSPSG